MKFDELLQSVKLVALIGEHWINDATQELHPDRGTVATLARLTQRGGEE